MENINNFFKNDIYKIYNEHKNKKSRDRLIKINDMLKYLALYSNNETSKEIAANKTNCASRTAFDKKLKSINISFFQDIFDKLVKLKENIINNDEELINLNNILSNSLKVLSIDSLQYTICSADGTCNNEIKKGVLFTNSNVHIYNNTTREPYNIINNDNKFNIFDNNKNNKSNKNKEIAELVKFIDSKSKDELSKIILILDRAYSSYDLILKLNEKNIKYVIRLKENFDILKDKKEITTNTIKINKILDNINVKIIKNTVESINEFVLSVNEIKTLKTNNNYHLITNLGDAKDFNDNLIIDLYKYRWEIEVYFKKIKELFKYQTFYLNDNNEIFKIKVIVNIVFVLVKLLILVSLKHDYSDSIKKLDKFVTKRLPKNLDMRKNKDKNILDDHLKHPIYEAKINVNFNNFYKIFNDDVLIHVIDGNFNLKHVEILNRAIIVNKDKQDRKHKRKSLIPYSKWYVKMYHKMYEDKKVYEAIIKNDVENLNKNLKSKAVQILKDLNIDTETNKT